MNTGIRIAVALCVAAGFGAAGVFGTGHVLDRMEAAAASGGGGEGSAAGSGPAGGPRATRVGVATPEAREVEDAVEAVGTVMPTRRVEIRPSVPGRVTEVAVASGDQVARGDLILQLDDRAQRARLAGAEATLQEARRTLERITELTESNAAAERRLDAARAAFGRAESEVMAAQAALEDRRIEAPFAGTLGLVDLDRGAYVAPQDVVVTLSDLSVVQVDIALPERYFARVAPGQPVTLTVPALPDRRFEGTVAVRDVGIDEASRSFDVRAEIDNSARALVGGMFARTRLVFETAEALAIPDDAIIAEGEETYVYTVEDGTARRRAVTPGQSLGGATEIAGLAADARVVVSGWNRLRDGAPVEVAEEIAREGLQ